MSDAKKDNPLLNNTCSQILFLYGFLFSLLLILTNWKKPEKLSKSPSNLSNNNSPTSDAPGVALSSNMENVKKRIPTVKKNQKTLSKFVEDNEKLINVLGVFTAITVFVSELRLQIFGYALSFAFMALTVILWLELWGKFPSGKGDWKLIWFENILTLTVMAIIFYWLIDFRDIWREALVFLIFSIISAVFSVVMKRFGIFNKLFLTQDGELKWLRYTFGFIIILIILYTSLIIAYAITPSINNALDSINEFIRNLSP